MERNLTEGSVFRNIVRFSLPYLLSYFLQTLYGMADLYIIGQYEGAAATTAVSIGSQVMHMITVIIVGLAMGTTVSIGQAVGGEDRRKTAKCIGNTVTLFAAVAVALTLVLLLLTKPITAVMSTPEEAVDGTVRYLTICFIGIPFITAYNIISSIFRGLGDSRSPMYFIAIACAVNIALDYLFIGGLGLGAAGAALGTTLAQTVSVCIALAVILRRDTGISLVPADLRPDREILQKILGVGLPIACQDGFIQIGFLVITVIANRRGLTAAAAVGIVEKIITFIFLVPSTLLSTVSAIGAQCIGAKKPERAERTLLYAVLTAVVYGLVMIVIVQFAADVIVRQFTTDAAVAASGGEYFRGYIVDALFAGIHFSFSGYFCAREKSWISFFHNACAICTVRIPGVWLVSQWFPETLLPMGLATATGSLLSAVICAAAFLLIKKKDRILRQ